MSIIKRFTLLFISLLVFFTQSIIAQDFVWAPDFPEGSTIPVLDAPDQNDNVQSLNSLAGEKGLMLFFSRSFDWCPFCMAQLGDITAIQTEIEVLGFNIASMTYDSIETLKLAEEEFGIGFTMLHDEAIKHVNAFGIRNLDHEPDSFAYGIPQPGILLISPDGVILKKFSEESFRDRPDLTYVLEAAAKL